MTDYVVDPELKKFATPTQSKYIDAVNEHGSNRKAATALGCAPSAVDDSIRRVKCTAALRGYAPGSDMTKVAPAPFVVKGTSTYYDDDGKIRGQWVKTKLDDQQRLQTLIDAFENGLADSFKGLAPLTKPPARPNEDLLVVYPMGDPHFGMYALKEEAGEDFDLPTAEKLTNAAIDRLVSHAPPSVRGLLLNLGDMLHADDSTNRTPKGNNPLDVDGRYHEVVYAAVRSMIYCTRRLLEKHEIVEVWMMRGNHDPHVAFTMAMCLSAVFENEPRVKVCLSPSHYKYMRFGKVLIGSTHGDGAKPSDLQGIMAYDRKEDWGKTEHRYWYCGHIHHKTSKEYPGVIVETFRTLAAGDAWHAAKGYRAGRDMSCIVHHIEHGEIERYRCDIGMLPKSKPRRAKAA